MIGVFVHGLILGCAIAAPVGPVGILVIRRTLAAGRAVGLASGLGAATADAAYGAVAAFGLRAVTGVLVSKRVWIQVGGGLVLLYLGITLFLGQRAPAAAPTSRRDLRGAYLSVTVLTLTNPATLISFAGAFAAFNLAGGSWAGALLLSSGVFLGSTLWWLTLTTAVGLARTRLTPAHLLWVNRAAGALLALFGLASLAAAARTLRPHH